VQWTATRARQFQAVRGEKIQDVDTSSEELSSTVSARSNDIEIWRPKTHISTGCFLHTYSHLYENCPVRTAARFGDKTALSLDGSGLVEFEKTYRLRDFLPKLTTALSEERIKFDRGSRERRVLYD